MDRRRRKVALYEYCGKFPETVEEHGNAKKCKREYVRTHPSVLETVKSECQKVGSKPRQVYERLTLDIDGDGAPRDLSQVQRIATTTNGDRPDSRPVGSRNLADDIQTIITAVHKHDFVREVHISSDDSPRILLYTDEQINDIARFCTMTAGNNVKSVLGIDRTFNLSPFYATVTVFKHRAVVRCTTQDAPLFIGPMLLHCNGKFRTYHTFFSHLYGLLADGLVGTEVGLSNLTTGTDDEKAMEKALKQWRIQGGGATGPWPPNHHR